MKLEPGLLIIHIIMALIYIPFSPVIWQDWIGPWYLELIGRDNYPFVAFLFLLIMNFLGFLSLAYHLAVVDDDE